MKRLILLILLLILICGCSQKNADISSRENTNDDCAQSCILN